MTVRINALLVHSDSSDGEDVIDQSLLVLVYLVFALQHLRGQVLRVHIVF